MSNPYQQGVYDQPHQPPKKSNAMVIIIILACTSFFLLMCCGVLAGLLLPAVNQARQAARKMTESNSIRSIGLALLEYEQSYKKLPPAYTVDANGNKLHSWRAFILPYLDEGALYSQIDFSKPWDAPENAKAREASIGVFTSTNVPLPPGHTLFRAIVHPNGIFSGPSQTDYETITDGGSNTLLAVQAGRDQSTHWMQPEDYSLAQFSTVNSDNTAFYGGTLVVFADGSVKFINIESLPPGQLEGMVTKDGNEAIMVP